MYEGDIFGQNFSHNAEKHRRVTFSCLKFWVLKSFGKLKGGITILFGKFYLTLPKNFVWGYPLMFRKICLSPAKCFTELNVTSPTKRRVDRFEARKASYGMNIKKNKSHCTSPALFLKSADYEGCIIEYCFDRQLEMRCSCSNR